MDPRGVVTNRDGLTGNVIWERDFDEALRTLFGPLRGFCERMLGDPHGAEDAAQQTIMQAYRAWGRFKGRSSRKSWLFRIAANVCARSLERARGTAENTVVLDAEAHAGGTRPEAGLEGEERARVVRLALQALSPAHRMVLVLFCIEELSHTEIAELLGCPEGTVWSRLHHARKAFEARLRERGLHETMEMKL